MRQFSIDITLEYLWRIAPEHHAEAREILETLPAGWHSAIPRSCRQHHGAVPWHLIAHALLALIDSAKFPSAARTRGLAEFIHACSTPQSGTHITNQERLPK